MNLKTSMITIAALMIAPSAFAQDTQTSPAPAASATPAPAPAAAGPVTDAEVSQFTAAALAATEIRKDTAATEADRNARTLAAITGSGLTVDRFNAIAQTMQSDPALNKRIQDSAAKQPAPAATPAAATPAP